MSMYEYKMQASAVSQIKNISFCANVNNIQQFSETKRLINYNELLVVLHPWICS